MDIEKRLSAVLSEFARTLATDFSIQAILDQLVVRIVDMLPVTGAGVTLISAGNDPWFVAASDESARRFEQIQSDVGDGPCLMAHATGAAVAVPDLRLDDRFPNFSRLAVEGGLGAVFAFPLHQDTGPLGALDLYRATPGPLSDEAMEAAQTLADVAAAYLLNAIARVDLEESWERARLSSLHDDKAVAALRASEALKTAVLDSAPDAVITIDEHDIVLEFNLGAVRTFGYSQAEALGRTLAELVIPPETRDDHRRGLERCLGNGGGPMLGRRTAVTAMRADGSRFPAEVSISAVDGIEPRAFTGFIRDLTEWRRAETTRRELEARVHQTERLESLGQLAGGVAHDFNNLLTVILNYATFIATAAPDGSSTRADADQIVASAERAAELTNHLLMFARREPVRRSPLDLRVITRDIESMLVRTLGGHIQISVHGPPELPLILADRGQIEQVLMNLCVNARDAMPDGGSLTIDIGALVVDEGSIGPHPAVRPGHYVRLSVTDTGGGMSADVAARAFDPFFSTKPAGEGTGLGLATVYGIVSDAGGFVDLRSDETGTTVWALFPVATPRPAEALVAAQTNPVSLAGGETVLVVEDQDAVRQVTVTMLRRNGYRVLEAADAGAAIRLASTTAFDLLLTDVVMPEISGRELAERLRSDPPTHRVLFLSGRSAGSPNADEPLGPDDGLLHKPYNETALLGAVHDTLHRSGRPQADPS